jgi:outer membrane receptor protein involved in Fe transport
MNDTLLSASYIGSDLRPDLGTVERIEVVRGPGSLLYGTGAFSGVVNVVPRAKNEPSQAFASAGSYDSTVGRAMAGFHYNFSDKAGVWASVGGARSDGPRASTPSRTSTRHGTRAASRGSTGGSRLSASGSRSSTSTTARSSAVRRRAWRS